MATRQKDLSEFIRSQRSSEAVSGLPLKDIRVLDMSTIVAAPSAAMHLGDAGAEVIKIENPNVPDGLRAWGASEENTIQPWYSIIGRNKFPVTINLKSEEGKKLFFELIEQSDVLVENFRPSVMDKLGLNADELLKRNPGLIIGKVSGYGQTGPYSKRPGFGTLAEAFSGFTFLNRSPEQAPASPPTALADFVVGLQLSFAIMVSMRNQKRGESGGQVIDISLYEPLFSMLGADYLTYCLTGVVPQPIGNELRDAAPRNNYRTKDGDWIAMSCSAQRPWERLAEAMGRMDMNEDPRFATNEQRIKPENRKLLNEAIQDWIGSKSTEEFLDISNKAGLTVGPIPDMNGIDKDAHYRERGTILEIEDPVSGTALRMPNVSYRFFGSKTKVRFPGLPHGSANNVIYQDLLGYKPEQVEELKNNSAI